MKQFVVMMAVDTDRGDLVVESLATCPTVDAVEDLCRGLQRRIDEVVADHGTRAFPFGQIRLYVDTIDPARDAQAKIENYLYDPADDE